MGAQFFAHRKQLLEIWEPGSPAMFLEHLTCPWPHKCPPPNPMEAATACPGVEHHGVDHGPDPLCLICPVTYNRPPLSTLD